MRGAILPPPQYAFMAWRLVKAQGQLYLYLYLFLYGEILAPRPTPKLEGHNLSTARDGFVCY